MSRVTGERQIPANSNSEFRIKENFERNQEDRERKYLGTHKTEIGKKEKTNGTRGQHANAAVIGP